jgi:hypothetical protein
MKNLTILILSLCITSGSVFATAPADSTAVQQFFFSYEQEQDQLLNEYATSYAPLADQLQIVGQQLDQAMVNKQYGEQTVALLLQKTKLEQELKLMAEVYDVNLTKLRYQKGLELIRLLYEKILGLDHHFSSLQTYQNIMSLSNPNSYPEFQQIQELLEQRLKKENAVKMPSLFSSNPYLSTTFSLVASLIGDGRKEDKEQDLEQVSCILDFTVRMNSELATIYYETEYLKEGNNSLKKECIQLFDDYVQVINYFTALDKCRKEDDWETVYEYLDKFVVGIDEAVKNEDVGPGSKAYDQLVDLEFSVDRLLDFLDSYNTFISQGEKYYQKFQIIATSYANEDHCQSKLPREFSDLKKDIEYSILKFNEAYNIAALKGSKLKDLLYGSSSH